MNPILFTLADHLLAVLTTACFITVILGCFALALHPDTLEN